MVDMDPIQDSDSHRNVKAEHSQYGAGETGGGKPADGINGNLAPEGNEDEVDTAEVGVPPEEDPKMGV